MPSQADRERVVEFLGRKENTQYLRIYQILLHATTPLSAAQILNQVGVNTSANNVSSKLNWMRRCGIVAVTTRGTSDLSNRRVDMWEAVERVPDKIEFSPARVWYVVRSHRGEVSECIEITGKNDEDRDEIHNSLVAKHCASAIIYRASES